MGYKYTKKNRIDKRSLKGISRTFKQRIGAKRGGSKRKGKRK